MKNFTRLDFNGQSLNASLLGICIMLFLSSSLKAQEIMSMEKKLSSLSVEERKSVNDLLFGNQGILEVVDGKMNSVPEAIAPIVAVRLSSSSDFSILSSSNIDFSSVEALTLKVKGNDFVNLNDAVFSKMTALKYVYVVFDHYMSENEVKSKFSLDGSKLWVVMYSLPE